MSSPYETQTPHLYAPKTTTPSNTLNQNQGGTLPAQTQQPQTQAPADSHLYAPSGDSPYQTTPVETPVPQSTEPTHIYAPEGNSPYQISTNAAQVTALNSIAKNTPNQLADALPVLFPKDSTVTSIQQTPQGYMVNSIPNQPPPTNNGGGNPTLIAPTPMNLLTNPFGVFGTMAQLTGIAVSKLPNNGPANQAVSTFLNLEAGGFGNMANQYATAKNFIGSIGGAKAEPLPYTPQNQNQRTGMDLQTIGAAIEVAVAAPIAAPALLGAGSVGGIVAAEAIGVGFNEIPTAIRVAQGQPVNIRESVISGFEGAAEGGVFGLVLGGAAKGVTSLIGRYGGEIGAKIAGTEAVTSIAGKAGVIGSRAGINAGLGGATNFILSGGNPVAAGEGAAFGAAFSGAGEIAGKVGGKLPLLKVGSSEVPYTTDIGGEPFEGRATWKGVYFEQGNKATPLIGKWGNTPDEGFRVSQLTSSEGGTVQPTDQEAAAGIMRYRPQSALEGALTRKVMLNSGISEDIVNISSKANNFVSMVKQEVKNPELFQDYLPKATKTSNLQETIELKETILKNSDIVEKIFGKGAAIPQENPKYKMSIVDPTTGKVGDSARVTGDWDLQIKPGVPKERVTQFTKDIFDIYAKNPLSGAKMEPGSTLIETIPVEFRGRPNATTQHAIDIHSDYDTSMNPNAGQDGTPRSWGIKIGEKPTTIEKLPVSKLTEQIAGKMQSILDINEKGTFGPVSHRIKDVPDFLVDGRTLADQVKNPIKRTKGMNELQDISTYFGTGNVRDISVNPTKEFILTKPETTIPTMGKSTYQVFTGQHNLSGQSNTFINSNQKTKSPFEQTETYNTQRITKPSQTNYYTPTTASPKSSYPETYYPKANSMANPQQIYPKSLGSTKAPSAKAMSLPTSNYFTNNIVSQPPIYKKQTSNPITSRIPQTMPKLNTSQVNYPPSQKDLYYNYPINQKDPYYQPPFEDSTKKSKSSFPQLPGGLSGEHGSGDFSPSLIGGLNSRKREYPILTASEFWG